MVTAEEYWFQIWRHCNIAQTKKRCIRRKCLVTELLRYKIWKSLNVKMIWMLQHILLVETIIKSNCSHHSKNCLLCLSFISLVALLVISTFKLNFFSECNEAQCRLWAPVLYTLSFICPIKSCWGTSLRWFKGMSHGISKFLANFPVLKMCLIDTTCTSFWDSTQRSLWWQQ